MKRETKYIVIKIKDAEKHLSKAELAVLQSLAEKVDAGRIKEGKHPMESVVVECDWPEYDSVWNMIEERVDAEDLELTKLESFKKGDLERLQRTLFVFVKNGECKCLSLSEAQEFEIKNKDWKHTATIDPAVILERMLNGHENQSDILDELQFGD